ncbi:MAG: ATP/GTP-binding protein [Candidatus Aenigmatarchaeota archaeon]
MSSLNIVILGPAGSGKTYLTWKFGDWIKNNTSNSVSFINFDPGVEWLPYKPNFDIKKFFSVQELMKRKHLGPNGALIECMNLMIKNKNKIKNEIYKLKTDFRIIDLPGQLEIFIFHPVVEILKIFERTTVGLFLIPSELLTPSGIAVSELLSLATKLRIEIPTVNIISKGDKIKNKKIIEKLFLKPEILRKNIEKLKIGVEKDLVFAIADIVEKISKSSRIIQVSAKKEKNIDILYGLVHEMLCSCGEI